MRLRQLKAHLVQLILGAITVYLVLFLIQDGGHEPSIGAKYEEYHKRKIAESRDDEHGDVKVDELALSVVEKMYENERERVKQKRRPEPSLPRLPPEVLDTILGQVPGGKDALARNDKAATETLQKYVNKFKNGFADSNLSPQELVKKFAAQMYDDQKIIGALPDIRNQPPFFERTRIRDLHHKSPLEKALDGLTSLNVEAKDKLMQNFIEKNPKAYEIMKLKENLVPRRAVSQEDLMSENLLKRLRGGTQDEGAGPQFGAGTNPNLLQEFQNWMRQVAPGVNPDAYIAQLKDKMTQGGAGGQMLNPEDVAKVMAQINMQNPQGGAQGPNPQNGAKRLAQLDMQNPQGGAQVFNPQDVAKAMAKFNMPNPQGGAKGLAQRDMPNPQGDAVLEQPDDVNNDEIGILSDSKSPNVEKPNSLLPDEIPQQFLNQGGINLHQLLRVKNMIDNGMGVQDIKKMLDLGSPQIIGAQEDSNVIQPQKDAEKKDAQLSNLQAGQAKLVIPEKDEGNLQPRPTVPPEQDSVEKESNKQELGPGELL